MSNPQDSFVITPRPLEVGGGWQLRLLCNGEEVGGGVFPLPAVENPEKEALKWWLDLNMQERGHWALSAGSTQPIDAWHAWREHEAWTDAEQTGYDWLESRGA